MRTLEEIGVPALPPGWSYRIGRPHWLGIVDFELIAKRKRFGSKSLATFSHMPEPGTDPEDVVLYGCRRVLRKYFDDLKYRGMMSDISQFAGTHDLGCTCR